MTSEAQNHEVSRSGLNVRHMHDSHTINLQDYFKSMICRSSRVVMIKDSYPALSSGKFKSRCHRRPVVRGADAR
ncbi:hypothetical protein TNCV_1744411 [Trichonephila clavipes]|nr:hypothetical protein TNCV_1744411 [Trichonephila clavipes]